MHQVKYSTIENTNEVGFLYNFADFKNSAGYPSQIEEIEEIMTIICNCTDWRCLLARSGGCDDYEKSFWPLYIIARCENLLSYYDQESVNDMKRNIKNVEARLDE